jgi:hypothetical protein
VTLRIVVSGMVAGDPHHGGATWAVLQYLLGLRRLGHDVWLVEPVAERPSQQVLQYFEAVCRDYGLADQAALVVAGTNEVFGTTESRLRRIAGDADVLLDIAGMLVDAPVSERIPTRVYLDLDPGFTQLWHDVAGIDMRFEGHSHFVTVGLGIGAYSSAPTCGRRWLTTVPPVVLECWPVAVNIVHDAFTTVANWRAYGSVEHDGVLYGQKAHSLRRLVEIPMRTDEEFVLALGIHPDETRDHEMLAAHRWQIIDPQEVTGSPAAYRSFVRGSKAEIGIAKSGYVLSRSGWFSDRSACYLAAGRPVVAQDTGFSSYLPTGDGLLAFDDVESATACIEDVRADYARHARSARAFAEAHLDSDHVLRTLLESVSG